MMTSLGSSLQKEMARLEAILGKPLAGVNEPAPPQCPVCQDLGMIKYDVPISDSRFGKFYPCPQNCEAVHKIQVERATRMMRQWDWERDYDRWTFDSWQEYVATCFQRIAHTMPADLRKKGPLAYKAGAYAVSLAFAFYAGQPFSLDDAAQCAFGENTIWPDREEADRGDKSPSVVLTGDPGLGKTGLAVAAANYSRMGGTPCVFSRVQGIIKRIQETYSSEAKESYLDVFSFFTRIPLLIIDEFGVKNYTPDRLEIFEEIMRERDRRGLPFLATTNLTRDEFYKQWQPQTADVVAKAHWIPIAGIKIRQTTKTVKAW